MRLIDTTTFDFVEKDLEGVATPDTDSCYAILSHRWTDNEMDYQTNLSLDKSTLREKGSEEGYNTALGKIYWASHIARQQEIPYFWIDTCCINKQDIHELNRSIRSMFHWREKATVCYAYLSSAPEPVKQLRESEHAFFDTPGSDGGERKPKDWFTRGWTLQELLAPRQMEFFNAEWIHIGSRSELQTQIQKAANIAPEHLRDFRTASVATKLSWAASRRTK